MYKKTHRHLTFFFTSITGLILVTMSIFYLYMSEHTQQINSRLSFSSDVNTVLSNCEQQNTLSYEWMSKMEANGHYLLAGYDGETPLTFNDNAHTEEQQSLLSDVEAYCEEHSYFTSESSSSTYGSTHREFNYHADSNSSYYVCAANITNAAGTFHLLILSDRLSALLYQLHQQRLLFAGLDLLFLLILWVFCWFFTGKLLHPIEENQRKQTQFVASASHELRTPLAVILSSLSAMKLANRTEQRHFLQVIESESQQMSGLINDMLTLASADNHSWTMEPTPVELDTLLIECYDSFLALSRQKKIAMKVILPDRILPPCLCDEKRIRQVLTILVHNALSYGNPDGFIKMKLSLTHSSYVIDVCDNGPGISDEDKKHIFERFYRSSHASSAKEHFGLGLCIAKEIMEQHNGHISVSDGTEGGTCFRISLPR